MKNQIKDFTTKHKTHIIYILIIINIFICGNAYAMGSKFYGNYSQGVRTENTKHIQEIRQNGTGFSEIKYRAKNGGTPELILIRAYKEDRGFRDYIDNMQVARNNPGNLVFANQPNATKDGRFAKFPDNYTGFRALIKQIELDMSRNLSLEQFMHKYSPPFENNTEKYIRELEHVVGNRKQSLKDLDILLLATAIVQNEHSIKF